MRTAEEPRTTTMERLLRLPLLLLACGCATTVSDRDTLRSLADRRAPPCPGTYAMEFLAQDSLPLEPFMSIPAVAVDIGSRRSTLLIDTGSPYNLLSPEVIRELELPVFGRRRIALLGREEETFQTCAHELRAGGLLCRHVPCIVSPGHLERGFLGITLQRADGILGMTFLGPLCVTIDLRRNEVRLREDGRAVAGHGVYTVPLVYLPDGRPCVNVTLGKGLRRLFLLDTGARRCVLREEDARALELPPLDRVSLLNLGVEVKGATTRLPRVALGGLELDDVDAYVLPDFAACFGNQFQGIVGIELFANLAITIDPARETLVIEGAAER
jgi:predicted aspartyl protease